MENEYKSERDANINYIRHALSKLSNSQMDYFARRVQCECENAYDKSYRPKFKLGVGKDRKSCGVYILEFIGKLPNYPLSILVSEMMAEIDGNSLYGIYDRENWKEVC